MDYQLETQKTELELQVFHETDLSLLPVNMNFLVPAKAPSILSDAFFFPVPHFLCFLVFPTEPERPHSLSLSPQLFSVCILCHVPGSPNSHYVPPFYNPFLFFHIYFLGELDFIWPRIPGYTSSMWGSQGRNSKQLLTSHSVRSRETNARVRLLSFTPFLHTFYDYI